MIILLFIQEWKCKCLVHSHEWRVKFLARQVTILVGHNYIVHWLAVILSLVLPSHYASQCKLVTTANYKQSLDEIFVISRRIKVEVEVPLLRTWFFWISQNHVISKQFLCYLHRPFCVLQVLVFDYFFDVLLSKWSKPGCHVFAYSLMARNTKGASLTWLPLEVMHCSHTWHDYPWSWASMTWLVYNRLVDDVPGADLKNSPYAFGQSEKR